MTFPSYKLEFEEITHLLLKVVIAQIIEWFSNLVQSFLKDYNNFYKNTINYKNLYSYKNYRRTISVIIL